MSYWLSEDKHLSASDIVFLVGSEDVGNKVKDNFLRDYCKEKKWRLRDIFTYDSRSTKYGYYESRSKKQAFDPNEYGKNDFKLVTIESFKGWESNRVIAIIEPDEARSKSKIQQSSRRVLNAMTRSRNGIFVLNFNDRYKDFPSQKFNS